MTEFENLADNMIGYIDEIKSRYFRDNGQEPKQLFLSRHFFKMAAKEARDACIIKLNSNRSNFEILDIKIKELQNAGTWTWIMGP